MLHECFILTIKRLDLAVVTHGGGRSSDMPALLAPWDVITSRLEAAQRQPASALLRVTSLAVDALIEIEATAAA
jgi:enamine deaminase RidA (YjgF/YER057c/UK114 family)